MGREVWKMKSLPAHSAACRKVSAITEVRNTYKNCKGSCDSRTFKQPHDSFNIRVTLPDTWAHCQSVT